jgi:hypothetical protein
MFKFHTILAVAATVALAGCDVTGSESGPGGGTFTRAYTSTRSAIGLPGGDAASAVTNAAFGGLIGAKLGASLDDEDRRLAYDAQIAALDRGAPLRQYRGRPQLYPEGRGMPWLLPHHHGGRRPQDRPWHRLPQSGRQLGRRRLRSSSTAS